MEIPTGVRDWIFELWHEGALRPFSITGISGFAVDDAAPQLVRERYGTAVVGFDALVREARFELGLGAIYEACYRHHARLTAPPPSVPPAPDPPHFNELMSDFGMPIEVQAVLNGYAVHDPEPTALFDDPHQLLTMGRVLSRWMASQQFDAAAFRLCSALDQLATVLWTAAGLDFPRTKAGEVRFPAFGVQDLKVIRRHDPTMDMEPFLMVARGEGDLGGVFQLGKELRDALTHRRRVSFVGHGLGRTHFSDGVEIAGDAEEHLAIGLALYEVVRMMAAEANTVMESRRSPTAGHIDQQDQQDSHD